jgi:hypothetical protein
LKIAASNAPTVSSSDGALEFEEEGAITLPIQKSFKDAMVKVLADFAGFRESSILDIESRLRVNWSDDSEFPATHVVRLVGPGVGYEEVAVFRAAAQFAIRELIPQRSTGEIETEELLTGAEKEFLGTLGRRIAGKFANKPITQGFVVRFGPDDLNGVTIQGVMAPLLIDEKVNFTTKGRGYSMGFDESKNTVFIHCVEGANDTGEPINTSTRLELNCHDVRMFLTMAQAYVNRSQILFMALVQKDARQKKEVITLTQLSEIAANDPDDFTLE